MCGAVDVCVCTLYMSTFVCVFVCVRVCVSVCVRVCVVCVHECLCLYTHHTGY